MRLYRGWWKTGRVGQQGRPTTAKDGEEDIGLGGGQYNRGPLHQDKTQKSKWEERRDFEKDKNKRGFLLNLGS
jgi:hypothetical protein